MCFVWKLSASQVMRGKGSHVTLMHGSPVNIVEMQRRRDVLRGDILFRIVDGIFQNGFTAKRRELLLPSYETDNFK